MNLDGLSSTDLPTGIWAVGGEAADNSDSDNLYIIDSGGNFYTEQEYKTTGPESGVVTTDDLAVTFFEFEPLFAEINVAHRRFTIGDAGEKTIHLAAPVPGCRSSTPGHGGFESLTLHEPIPTPSPTPPTLTIERAGKTTRSSSNPLPRTGRRRSGPRQRRRRRDRRLRRQPPGARSAAGRPELRGHQPERLRDRQRRGLRRTRRHVPQGAGLPGSTGRRSEEAAIVDPMTGGHRQSRLPQQWRLHRHADGVPRRRHAGLSHANRNGRQRQAGGQRRCGCRDRRSGDVLSLQLLPRSGKRHLDGHGELRRRERR